jgi:putative transposase
MLHKKARMAGETHFFTVRCTKGSPSLVDNLETLRAAIRSVIASHPFYINALMIAPDHLHAIWTLPEKDHDYSSRWMLIQDFYSCRLAAGSSRCGMDFWQNRIKEQPVRNMQDLEKYISYIHYDPVRHGYVKNAADWLHSSIHRYISEGIVTPDWAPGNENRGQERVRSRKATAVGRAL